MRRFLVATLALAALLPAAPLVEAAHIGPCWHEYIEAAIYAASRPPKEALQVIGRTVDACTSDVVCDVVRPCTLP